MDLKILIPVLVSFTICVILCPIMIPFLKKLKFGQYVRDDGPQSHLKKTGTPTMGGVIILITIVIVSLFYLEDFPDILPILFCTVGFGIIGFLDDYIKVVMKRSEGLSPFQKILGQIIVTSIFGYYLVNYTNVGTTMLIPFTGGFENGQFLEVSYLFIPILFFVTLGTVNGVNFTGIYGNTTAMGWKSITLPKGHTWKSYMYFLLDTLPEKTRQNYLNKLEVSKKSWVVGGAIDDKTIKQLEEEGAPLIRTGQLSNRGDKDKEVIRFDDYLDDTTVDDFRRIPTYKRMCICIMKNDHTCKYMGFAQTKKELDKRKAAISKYKDIIRGK